MMVENKPCKIYEPYHSKMSGTYSCMGYDKAQKKTMLWDVLILVV